MALTANEDLYYRLNYLAPGAVFAFWPVDETNIDDDKGYSDLYTKQIINGFKVMWYPENNLPLPTLQEIQSIDETILADHIAIQQKNARNEHYKKDLSIVSAYQVYKTSNPNATFSDYLDMLESMEL